MQSSICSFLKYKQINVLNLDKTQFISADYIYNKKNKFVKQIFKPHLITFTSSIETENINEIGYLKDNSIKISILKSNLEKSLRLNIPDIALASSQELLKFKSGAIELLQKLSIIVFEDKFDCYYSIANEINCLIWIMITERSWKGWTSWLFSLIHYLSKQKYSSENRLLSSKNINWSKNIHSCCLILCSFYNDSNYRKLLKNTAKIIEKRLIEPLRLEIKNFDPKLLYILKSSIDTECAPEIIHFILMKFPYLSLKDIKQNIIQHSSLLRYNSKSVHSDIWCKIKKDVFDFQTEYIKKLKWNIFL